LLHFSAAADAEAGGGRSLDAGTLACDVIDWQPAMLTSCGPWLKQMISSSAGCIRWVVEKSASEVEIRF